MLLVIKLLLHLNTTSPCQGFQNKRATASVPLNAFLHVTSYKQRAHNKHVHSSKPPTVEPRITMLDITVFPV